MSRLRMGVVSFFAIALLAATAAAQGFSIAPGTSDGAGGFVTPLDNPVFLGEVTLGPLEGGTRTAANAWEFSRFELQMLTSCTEADPFCTPAPTRSDFNALATWPREVNTWQEGQVMPVEAHGLQLGISPATVRLDKFTREGALSTVGSIDARLTPGTIVIPVNVVVVLPAASVSSGHRQFMLNFWTDPFAYQAMFDDHWGPRPQRFSQPGGLLNAIQGQWTVQSKPSVPDGPDFNTVALGRPYLRPDDVFAQCGIQFRMVSMVTIEETNPRNVFFSESDGSVLCVGSDFLLRGIYRSWKTAARDTPSQVLFGAFNQSGMTIVFSPRVDNQFCSPFLGGAALASDRLVTIAVQAAESANDRLLLVHEMGHALGMDHPGQSPCGNNFMCGSSGGWTTHLPACEIRDGAPAGEVPFNCVPVANETVPAVSSCALARTSAGGVSAAAEVPVPMEPPQPAPPQPGGGGPGAGGGSSEWRMSGDPLSFDSTLFTEGAASLLVGGSGYRVVTSPNFRTADWFRVGTKLAFDVYLAAGQPNPWWLGSLDVSVSVPTAGINNAYLGHRELTGLTTGAWHTVEVDVPDNVRNAFLGDFAGGSIAIAVNTPGGAPAVRLDNLRFAGTVVERTVAHRGPVSGGASNPLFGFDNPADWSSPVATVRQVPGVATQGGVSLGVTATGYAEIISRPFNTAELVGATENLSVDIFVPLAQPNPYWIGAVQAFATCPAAGIFNQYLGQRDLLPLFHGEFNTVVLPPLPANVATTFGTPGNACTMTLALNVNNGSGEYLLDNLAFRQ